MAARIAVFCSGYGSNFQAILDAVRKRKLRAEIALMVCDRPGAYAVQRAARFRVPLVVVSPELFKSRSDYDKFIVRVLKNQKVGVIVLAGFMRILTPYFIKAYRGRILNIHPSLLPAFKGAHAIRDAFEAKAPETGVTVHVVTEKLDSGPILAQKKIKIGKEETRVSLETKIHCLEHRLYPKAIRDFIQS